MYGYSRFFSLADARLKRRLLMMGVFLALIIAELGIGTNVLIHRPYLLVLPFVPAVLLALFWRLEYGILALIPLFMVFRVGISTGTASKLPVSLIFIGLLVALWLVKMALERNVRFVKTSLNIPVIIYLTIVVLSLFWSAFVLDPQVIIGDKFVNVQMGTIAVTALSVLLTLFCANIVRSVGIAKACYWIVIAGTLVYVPLYTRENFLSGVSLANIPSDAITLDTLSRVVNTGGLFPMWVCCLSFGLLLHARELSHSQRFYTALALAFWLFRLFVLTLNRISGWLPTLIGLLIILLVYSRKWFFALGALAIPLIIANRQLLYDSIIVVKENEGTLSGGTSRESLWTQAFNVAKDHLILGTGPAGYTNYYMTYYRDHALSTHNNYLDMLLQYGVLGLVAFCAVCLFAVYEVWKSSRLQPRGSFGYGFTMGAFGATCAMFVAMWLGDWVIPFAYNQTIAGFTYTGYNWLFIGLAMALGYTLQEQQVITQRSDRQGTYADSIQSEAEHIEQPFAHHGA